MKNIIKSIAALAIAFAAVSCHQKADFKSPSFLRFEEGSYLFPEDTGTVQIPVCAYASKGQTNTSVSFEIVNGTAVQGTNFTVEPANGVLNFNGEDKQYITLKIIDLDGVISGNLSFSINLTGCDNDYTTGGTRTASVVIKDMDHPLFDLFGAYTMKGVALASSGSLGYYTWDLTLSEYPGYLDRIYLDNITPFGSAYSSYFPSPDATKVYGVVNEDKTKISIPTPQPTEFDLSSMFSIEKGEMCTLYLWNGADPNGEFVTKSSEVVFELDKETGNWTTGMPYGYATPGYVSEGWFYYYMNAYSTFNPNYPTFFVKK